MLVYLSLVFSSFFFSGIELFKNNKKNLYLEPIKKGYIFILFLLFIFNRNNNDYQNYLKIFKGEFQVKEKGYIFLVHILNFFKGNHNFIILILGILLIYTLFYLYRIKYVFCLISLYSIYVFAFDINQIRNLFCILFIMIGIKFLQKKKDLFYLIFNGLAASFQSLGYIYFVFYFLQKIKLKKYIKIISVLFICGFFTLFIFPKAMEFFFPDKAQAYFDRKPRFGMILYYIFIIMDIFIIKCKEKIKKEDILLIKFTLFPIIFLPYSFFFLELIHRVWRNALYIKWFYLLKGLGNEKKKYFIFSLLATQQFMLIGADFIKSKEFVINLVSQLGNLGFYF